MQTRAQLSETYDTADSDILDRIERIQRAGKRHGAQGWYPDGEFCSDADWCNGIGAELVALERETDIDAFDAYLDAHNEGLAAYRTVKVTLTAYNMGSNATEAEFDAWVAYVSNHLPDHCPGFDVEIDAFPFRSGKANDHLVGEDDPIAVVDAALDALWDNWCSAGATDG